jgi:aconitase A
MTQVGQDTLGARSTMTVGGKDFAYYSLKKAGEKFGDISRLPFSMKVLLENLLRFEDGGFTVSTDHIKAHRGALRRRSGRDARCHFRAGRRYVANQPAGPGQPGDRPLGHGR